jgi:hypothetical protein
MDMGIICDIDGTLCHCQNPRLKVLAREITQTRIPSLIICSGVRLINPKIDWEIIEGLRLLSFQESVWAHSARPKETENYTRRFLEKNEISFLEGIDCLGVGKDIARRKIENAIKKECNILVDDDQNVLEEADKEGLTAYSPQDFKLFLPEMIK